jgi:hypothetical protein
MSSFMASNETVLIFDSSSSFISFSEILGFVQSPESFALNAKCERFNGT